LKHRGDCQIFGQETDEKTRGEGGGAHGEKRRKRQTLCGKRWNWIETVVLKNGKVIDSEPKEGLWSFQRGGGRNAFGRKGNSSEPH